jgi:hypothetical protein
MNNEHSYIYGGTWTLEVYNVMVTGADPFSLIIYELEDHGHTILVIEIVPSSFAASVELGSYSVRFQWSGCIYKLLLSVSILSYGNSSLYMHPDHWKRTEYEPSSTDAANELGTISMTRMVCPWGSDLIIPFCRLSITTESFIPSTVKLCNRLDQFDRNLDTLTKFKKAIRKEQSDNTKRIQKHFYYGPRKLIIILTQLRNSFSFLNYQVSRFRSLVCTQFKLFIKISLISA